MQISQVALRSAQLIFLIITISLIGNVIADAFAGNDSAINYAMFVCVFDLIVLFYGFAAAIMESLNVPIVLGAMDALATLFTLIAGIVLAARLNVHSCFNAVCLINIPF